ncbi:Transmembrane protein [Quillaja saponaria]|uniref:Transmembrane protein n=1 Tax=Quillaja saponaria TaxID=32244 RepID=A0AAD7PXA1_QUISA|nr:Transmembrane protein [Quillaja saponaria]
MECCVELGHCNINLGRETWIYGIGLAAYLSRGSRQRGLLLMLVFFIWGHSVRLLRLFDGWHKGGSGIGVTSIYILFAWLLNVTKWVAFVVYYYDCKRRFLEKKIDVEEGKEPLVVSNWKSCDNEYLSMNIS